ncbi:MAG: methionine gamma-lyase family protein [Eubacteriales bacterium]|nr:methionine gamma-lyase family protein [Eubacteriales bacterium]MDY3332662.1 methionine gamma-lyase family protein [Gallibacter sp.]
MNIKEYLKNNFGISEVVFDKVAEAEKQIATSFSRVDEIAQVNQYKVLRAFQKNNVSDRHFAWNTGYGYDDVGRDVTEKVFADVFNTEAALVRTQIVNGTHALSIAITSSLRPGDEVIYVTGKPYDTLEEVIGIRGEAGRGSLNEFGITYNQVELKDNKIDFDAIKAVISDKTKMVCMQRATGYAWREAISIEDIRECVALVKSINKDIITMIDNCYGEFLDILEPTDVGIDIMAGSLIKNPGGGLALSGGYIVGRQDLIDMASYRLTCPGIGGECGLTFGQTRSILQGLFMAPSVVSGAIKGAMLCGQVYKNMNYDICPEVDDIRGDIIQSIKLGSKEAVVAFCQGIQKAAPVDCFVSPEPWDMPGYSNDVIMAAGAFVQGSSIELSADAPIRDPYIVYFQGGLTYEHSKVGVLKSLQELYDRNLIG